MYRDIYTWNVMDEIEKGKLVCVTDRQKGENFYCNGMTVNDLIELLKAAKEVGAEYTVIEQKTDTPYEDIKKSYESLKKLRGNIYE